MAVLEINNVSKSFHSGGLWSGRKNLAVDQVSFNLSGEAPWVLGIVGESGSGKTTLARMILRLLSPTLGTIRINGVLAKRELNTSREMISFKRLVQPVFQNPFDTFSNRREVYNYLIDTATNLEVAKNASEARSMVAAALEAVGLSANYVRGKFSRQFSGGELQRISIARALVAKPALIVADEPVASIDASLKMSVVNLFIRLKEQFNTSFIYITHDLATSYYLSDYVAIMYKGKVVEYGPSAEIMIDPVHPYTILLMESLAEVGKRWIMDDSLVSANAPDQTGPVNFLSGCPFYSRCRFARDVCRQESPPLVELSDSRTSLCFRHVNYQMKNANEPNVP